MLAHTRLIVSCSATLVVAFAAGCSRTGLGTLGAFVAAEAGGGAPSGTAGSGGDGPLPPPPPCHLVSAGPIVPFLSFAEGRTDAPQMAVLDPGAPDQIARVAYQAVSEDANFWHPEVRIESVSVGEAWPDGVTTAQAPTLYGFDAHAGAELARAPGASPGLALAFYHGDEASGSPAEGVKFRSFDPVRWTAGPESFVDPDGEAIYSLVAGRSVDAGQYQGDGYAAAWRGAFGDNTEPKVAVLDATGAIVLGPIPVTLPEPYPGRATDVVWSGASYLVATAFGACTPGGPPCAPASMVVTRLQPSDGSLALASSVSVIQAGNEPRRPAIAAYGDSIFLEWSERIPDDDEAPRTVRLARLDPSGELLGSPETLADTAHPTAGIALSATSAGVVVMWGEAGDLALPSSTPGHSRIVLHHRELSGAPVDPAMQIPCTAFASVPSLSAAALDHPRSLLLSWAATSEDPNKVDMTFLARLDCKETP